MTIIQTATGKEINCKLVNRSDTYDILTIHTNAITPAEAYIIFGNPEETKILSVYEQNENCLEEKIHKATYRGFTDCYLVKKSPLFFEQNHYMIWLNRPVRDDPAEEYTDEEIQEGRNAIELLNIIFGNE